MLPQLRQSLRPARRPLNELLRTRVVSALVKPRRVDDYLELIDPLWSVQYVRARVVRIHEETRRAVSLWLQPNELWRGFRAGQYVRLTISNRGVQYSRCFSLSSAPADGLPLRVTIQTVVDGCVSEWARQYVQVGDIVEVSQALGEFVLPHAVPRRLLFITGGSGITPVMSLARQLTHERFTGELYWFHYSRDEVILADELADLERTLPGLRLFVHNTGRRCGVLSRNHFSEEQLHRSVPEYRSCEVYACGPAALIEDVTGLFRERGLLDRLQVEHFLPSRRVPIAGQQACRVEFQRSAVVSTGTGSLLDRAEASGLLPRFGCRMGVCRSCVCRKISGVVRNELTGRVSTEPDEDIQLCISTACSDVVLDL